MAKAKGKKGDLDLRPFIEKIGLKKYLAAVETGDIIDTVGPETVLKTMGVDKILANLSAKDLQKIKERLK